MAARIAVILALLGLVAACAPRSTAPPALSGFTETPSPTAVRSPTPAAIAMPLDVPAPSYRVAAFYYPWYGTPGVDGQWIHWTQDGHIPPDDIASDFFPVLGAYSSNDPAVVARHMQWLRQAGIGVMISSWWGQGSREDRAIPLLLESAEQHGIKVAFHIEPYSGRTAESLVSDIRYLYERYGGSPAFFRSAATSRYSPGPAPRGMFFIWNIGSKGAEGERVEAGYWRPAMDGIHALAQGALIIANTRQGSWIVDGHFDGLYNYASLHLEESGGFDWARSLPAGALYVPSVLPGFSARRVGYPEDTYVERRDGQTYDEQWAAALGTGIPPELVTITSFNEWHEGTQIEPARPGDADASAPPYADFGSLAPEGYLDRTRQWVDRFLAASWPAAQRVRIRIATTSDWTTLEPLRGGAWARPELASVSPSAAAEFEAGDRLLLTQPLADAQAGAQVEMVWELMLTGLTRGEDLVLQIDRGSLGSTQVTVYRYAGGTPVEIMVFVSDRLIGGRNSLEVAIPVERLIDPGQ